MATNPFQNWGLPDFSSPGSVLSNPSTNPGALLDPFGSSLLGGIFGDDEDEFQPYIDDQGRYVFNPSKNPVPVANVPGASKRPSKGYRKQASEIQAIVDLLPYYQQAVSGQVVPAALANLAAQQATSPQLAQLMTELYGTYGPQLNKIGSDIARQNALAQVGTDTAALEQARTTLLPQALAAAKQYDPEFFATRELTSNRLGELLRSIDLTSGLSDVEKREVEQALAIEGNRRGTANAPSNLDTVSNAMQYGQAGFNRLQTNRSALSTAIANATAALPTFKSGVDVFQVATGRSSTPNTGNQQFTGVTNPEGAAGRANTLASGLLGNIGQLDMTQMNINANKKDWADYLNQVTSSIGDIAGIAGGIACWIARRVYGEKNPQWKKFRHWLAFKASKEFRDWYIKNSERVSKTITDVEAIKIRAVMDMIIAREELN